MHFLTGVDIQKQVRTIVSRNGEVMAAVAYWGRGAAELTGLGGHEDPASVRIICDLLSLGIQRGFLVHGSENMTADG